jgi:hypothetical protein
MRTVSSSWAIALSLTVVACSGSGPTRRPETATPPSAATAGDISLSDPSSDAKAALEACQILTEDDLRTVVGIGELEQAADATRFANFTGLEPELKGAGPAWLITTKGDRDEPNLGEVWVDPTCLFVGGEAMWYSTGGAYEVLEGGKRSEFLPPLIPIPSHGRRCRHRHPSEGPRHSIAR